MHCPNCEQPNLGVEETRNTPEVCYRVRRCKHCGWRVTTTETWAENQSIPEHIRKPKKGLKNENK